MARAGRASLRKIVFLLFASVVAAAMAVGSGSSPGHAGEEPTLTLEEMEALLKSDDCIVVIPQCPIAETTTKVESLPSYLRDTIPDKIVDDFQGAAYQDFYNEDPALLEGTYINYFLSFETPKQAKKFKTADVKDVLAGSQLEKVGKFKNGAILDDGQGHINVMFTVENVAIDIRIGVAETQPGEGVDQAREIADLIFEAFKQQKL